MERTRYTEMLRSRIREKRRFIQVLAGPRKVGKSTIIADVLSTLKIPYVSESADNVTVSGEAWLKSIWDRARILVKQYGEALVVIDEIQKIAQKDRGEREGCPVRFIPAPFDKGAL